MSYSYYIKLSNTQLIKLFDVRDIEKQVVWSILKEDTSTVFTPFKQFCNHEAVDSEIWKCSSDLNMLELESYITNNFTQFQSELKTQGTCLMKLKANDNFKRIS